MSQCTAFTTRIERNPDHPATEHTLTARCRLSAGHGTSVHQAPDPFDPHALIVWNDNGASLVPIRGLDTSPYANLDNGRRVLDDSPSASDTLGAPSQRPPFDLAEADADQIIAELGTIADVLARHVGLLRADRDRERRLRRDAEAELVRLRSGQVAA